MSNLIINVTTALVTVTFGVAAMSMLFAVFAGAI